MVRSKGPRLYVNVSRIRANSRGGIPRTVVSLARELVSSFRGYQVRFVSLDVFGNYVSPSSQQLSALEMEYSSSPREELVPRSGDVVLELDLSLPPFFVRPQTVRRLVKTNVRVVYVLYDLLPLKHPEFFPFRKKFIFWLWMRSVLRASEVVSISEHVESEFLIFSQGKRLHRAPITTSVSLATNFHSPVHHLGLSRPLASCFQILMVGTLEPRKGLAEALRVFENLWTSGLQFGVTIAGSRGWKSKEMVRLIVGLQSEGRPLEWADSPTDSELQNLYRHSHLLVANSYAEGFGLPLVEALGFGIPVACRDIPVFRECTRGEAFFYSNTRELASILREQISAENPTIGGESTIDGRGARTWSDVCEDAWPHIVGECSCES